MNTPAILSSATILPTSAPASGSASSRAAAGESSFNQVLQRELSEKHTSDQAARPESKPPGDKPTQASASHSSSETKKADSSGEEHDEEKRSDESEKTSDAARASTELIALVANMAQIGTPVANADASNADVAPDVQIESELAPGKGKNTAFDLEMLAGKAQPAESGRTANALSDFAHRAKGHVDDAGSNDRTAQLPALQAAPLRPTEETAAMSDVAALTPDAGALSMQQALNKVQGSAVQAAERLTPPVGTPAWDQAVGQKVVWMVAGAQQSASLTLNPPDLGPLQVVLNVNNAQANATFIAAQPEVRQALEAALPKLREMLGDAGIQLGQANISAGTPQHGGHSEQNGKPSSPHLAEGRQNEPQPSVSRQQVMRHGTGMVDTFA